MKRYAAVVTLKSNIWKTNSQMPALARAIALLLLVGAANPVFSEEQPPAKPPEKASPAATGQSDQPIVNYNEAASAAVREARRKQIEANKRKNGELDPCVIRAVMSDAERRVCGISVK